MKYLFLTLVLVIVTSFTSGHYKQDTLKIRDSIMPIAIDNTNNKVDSIFEAASKPITYEQFKKGLIGLMEHMDTLQVAYFLAMQRADSIDSDRHKEYVAKMNVIEANTELRKENKELEKTKKWAEKGSHVLILFFTVFAAIKFSQGLDIGFRKMKNVDK